MDVDSPLHGMDFNRVNITSNVNKRQNVLNKMDRKRKYDDYDRNRPSTSGHKRRRSLSPQNKKIDDYKYELSRFLEEHCNLKSTTEFWTFYTKYKTRQTLVKNDIDKNKLLNIDFDLSNKQLYEKLPLFDKRGDKVRLLLDDFKDFLLVLRIYLDFQQKSKFSKLKKLRGIQKDLPIAQYKNEIINSLADAKVMLIAGDTGCGKSTQVPQYVLEAGYKKIVCTQPRRIACVSLAKRVSYETLTDYKSTVGYQIRFERTKRADTSIIFMTEGLLLRQASEEETLNSYDLIILDEVHERHLHGDFLIGIMKCLLSRRNDVKLILMSATINLKLFSSYFKDEDVKVIQVPGRLYPIEIHYKPIVKDPYERKRDRFDCQPYMQIIQMIDEKYEPHQKGDLLIFLNGYSEISTLAEAVREYAENKQNWIVLELHSSLSLEEQDKVFDYPPAGVRKCIVSTNIAETSVTIDGIRFVIDSGKVNRMMYHTNGGVNKLSETNISQDSAKQRSGRAGRTGPGIGFRMYSEEDLSKFEAFTPAEIHLVPLESLILQMISLGLSDIAQFPFIEKPSSSSIEESLEKLKFSGALSLEQDCLALTPLGDALSQLPVDLTIGKMLITSTVFGNVNSVLAVASLLSVQSPLTQNAYKSTEGRDIRRPMDSDHGDPISLLNYYKEWLSVKYSSAPVQGGSRTQENSRTWARKRCLEEQRFYECTKLIEQFRDTLCEAKLLPKIEDAHLTSSDRSMRHGELKKLKHMRYNLKNENQSRQKKQLKHRRCDDEDEQDNKTDLRDVEFRITNDFKRLEKLLNESSADSYRDVVMLKLILTNGLYPQIALQDEFNSSKSVSEKLYHTKNKNFIFLRPMSYFANNPDCLELHNDDIEVPPPGYFSKRPISRKHQLLVYQSILETKKVYLVNTMRMRAMQTLMLFAKTVATNLSLTKFVFDDFISVDAPYYGQGKTLLTRAIKLRNMWTKELESKLKDAQNVREDKHKIYDFIEELVRFFQSEVSYNVKRLLPADLKTIYTESPDYYDNILKTNNVAGKNPFDRDYEIKINGSYGGFNVTKNVVYGCLIEEEWSANVEESVLEEEHECIHCKMPLLGRGTFETLQHESFCRPNIKVENIDEEVTQPTIKPNSKQFTCEMCGKELFLTPVDILRHKKNCK
ncbi:unnamed protein product [Brassicogethes aeneus]|uniref:ATP-dependent RNA helicase DHX34 n=1 Tax=Brassicogethes aeneus TaxID=1431903 RepID=A0A9P0FDT4_BRAAE|nr:unnamed protein product [Brassicogethes aeneus]